MLVPGLTLVRGGVDNTELAYRVEGVGEKIEGAAKYTVVCRPGTIGLVCPHTIERKLHCRYEEVPEVCGEGDVAGGYELRPLPGGPPGGWCFSTICMVVTSYNFRYNGSLRRIKRL